MAVAETRIAMIGFGEAGAAFAEGMGDARNRLRAFDIKTDGPDTREAKFADYARARVDGRDALADALADAGLVLSLVTADQALAAAEAAAAMIAPGALYCDMNSVAPDTKRRAAARVESAGGRYVDVAVMAPVRPQGVAVPLLVSGPHAGAAAAALASVFATVSVVAGPVGAASAIKMIRSVMVKGLEALSAECMLAAEAAGVSEQVIASLDASWPGADWSRRADYNLDRMLVHGRRRAAELAEVVKTLEALGVWSDMTAAALRWQSALGSRSGIVPDGLAAKTRAILGRKADAA